MQSIKMIHVKLFTLIIVSICTNNIISATIVFLQGTGCAGKTSICKEIAKLENWKIVDEDAIFFDQVSIRCATIN